MTRAEGRISYGHLGRTNSCLLTNRNCRPPDWLFSNARSSQHYASASKIKL